MKKLLSALLVIVLLNPLVAYAESTDRRGLIEFVELYMQRITKYQIDNGMELDFVYESSLAPSTKDNYLILDSTAGSIYINQEDFTVHSVGMVLYFSSEKSKDNIESENNMKNTILKCIVAMSALEYDGRTEHLLKILKIDTVEEARLILHDILSNFGSILDEAVESGGPVSVYSGNYEYSIGYFTKDGGEMCYLIAEERQ